MYSISIQIFDSLKIYLKRIYFIEECLAQQFFAALHPELYERSLDYNYSNYIDPKIEERRIDEYPNFEDHILWAAPKNRRSVEKRRSRRIGAVDYYSKLIPYKKLLTCLVCGSPHEVGKLCPSCYSKVMKVTESIKMKMINADGLKPVEHDFEPVFEGEKIDSKDGFYEGKRIIEIPEQRPTWFAKKLTQKSNVITSDETIPKIPNPLQIT